MRVREGEVWLRLGPGINRWYALWQIIAVTGPDKIPVAKCIDIHWPSSPNVVGTIATVSIGRTLMGRDMSYFGPVGCWLRHPPPEKLP